MNPPEFDSATVEEMPNGVIRVRGNAQSFNELLYVLMGFAAFISIFFAILQPGSVINLFGSAAFALVFFTLIGLIPYFLLTYGIRLLRVVTGYHKLWWDDFTFDGKDVKSGRFKINVGDISFVESGIQKFTDSDPWHYASIMSSNGVEIGRVMVVYRDKKKMVNYLSDLFEAT